MACWTLSCPNEECKKVLIKNVQFKGSGSFETYCPHCKKDVILTLGEKQWIKAVLKGSVIAIVFIGGLTLITQALFEHTQMMVLLESAL